MRILIPGPLPPAFAPAQAALIDWLGLEITCGTGLTGTTGNAIADSASSIACPAAKFFDRSLHSILCGPKFNTLSNVRALVATSAHAPALSSARSSGRVDSKLAIACTTKLPKNYNSADKPARDATGAERTHRSSQVIRSCSRHLTRVIRNHVVTDDMGK